MEQDQLPGLPSYRTRNSAIQIGFSDSMVPARAIRSSPLGVVGGGGVHISIEDAAFPALGYKWAISPQPRTRHTVYIEDRVSCVKEARAQAHTLSSPLFQVPPHPQEPMLTASPRMLLPSSSSKPPDLGAGTPLSTHHQMQLLQQLLQQQQQQTQVAVAQVLLSLLPSSQAPLSWA